jgi:AcrR family transcriptional regulator
MTVEAVRSDARRNRERLIASARELFAARGLNIPVEDITAHAELGMGTLYRHFPTKETLIDAVLEDAFAEYVALLDAALRQEDPWAGLEQWLRGALAAYAANRALADAGRRRMPEHRRLLKSRLRTLAKRADVDADDLEVVLQGGIGVVDRSPTEDARGRYVRIALGGLRA